MQQIYGIITQGYLYTMAMETAKKARKYLHQGEGWSMKHKIWFDKSSDILWMEYVGHLKRDEVQSMGERSRTLLNGRKARYAIMDLSHMESFPDDEVCRQLSREVRESRFTRVALVGEKPEIKMVGVIILQYLDKHIPAKFFLCKTEATQWMISATSEPAVTA